MAKRGRPSKSRDNKQKQSGSKKKKQDVEYIDTELYEVENILDCKLEDGQVMYQIRWKGYKPEDDSYEPEYRLMCPDKIRKFAISRFKDKFSNVLISDILQDCENCTDAEFLDSGNMLAIIGKRLFERGSVNFIEHDSIAGNRRFLKGMKKSDNEWYLNTFINDDEEKFGNDIKQYCKEVEGRIQIALCYPLIKVYFPLGYDTEHYPTAPPPNYKVTLNILYPGQQDVTKSTQKGFGEMYPFVNRNDDLRDNNNTPIEEQPRWRFMLDPVKMKVKRQNKFHCNLSLRFSKSGGWKLCADHVIPAGKPILQILGEVRDECDAHTSMVEDGFPIAVSSIFKIAKTGKVLDQRNFFDFSKFLQHSCEPNCEVRLEIPPNEFKIDPDNVPELVVVATEDVKNFGEHLSLDFFKFFVDDIEEFFGNINDPLTKEENGRLAYLTENRIDFIHCDCGASSCRQILYIDTAMIGHDKKDRQAVYNNMRPHEKFKGTRL